MTSNLSSDEILFNMRYEELYLYYKNKLCKKCKKQQERKCGLLVGGSRTSCMYMESLINQKLKHTKKHLINKLINELKENE